MVRMLSWNVNGMRAVLKNGFLEWLVKEKPDILCLQETRAHEGDLPYEVLNPPGYKCYLNPAKKKGYSGTGLYSREEPLSVSGIGVDRFDDEGRVQVITFADFTIVNGYWPNSQPERARLDYKLDFVKTVTRHVNKLVKEGKNVVLCGDMNIAHQPIDIARPKQNEDSPGYYIEEREAMTRFLKHGYVDTFRAFCDEPEHYSWWSYRAKSRERNVGWRLDYHLANKGFMPRIKHAWIASDVFGSDHCPVGIEID